MNDGEEEAGTLRAVVFAGVGLVYTLAAPQ